MSEDVIQGFAILFIAILIMAACMVAGVIEYFVSDHEVPMLTLMAVSLALGTIVAINSVMGIWKYY